MKLKYMEMALEEAKKCCKTDDVPVGAVIVKNNKIIAKAHNKKEKNKIVTHHAEIIAIEKACKKNKSWRLDDCVIYITLEPCLMCYGAILQSRISKIFYATSSEKFGFKNNLSESLKKNIKIQKIDGVYDEISKEMLRDFFSNKRN